MTWKAAGLLRGREGRTGRLLGPGSEDRQAGAVRMGWERLAGLSALSLPLCLACWFRLLSNRHSKPYTSSAAPFTRSNWVSSVCRRERSCWISTSSSMLSQVLVVRLSPSSWLEEVEARELSEAALGVAPCNDRESWLEEREGSGSIPSKRTLWRNCGKRSIS